ncbi:MAG: transketolase [Clostridiaceae bacterium]|nr:transketolase [Clostridiaceae bacterium]
MDAQAKKDVALFAARMRRHIVEQVFRAQSGHIGGSMSSADILAVLYTQVMRVDPADPKNPDRDRFVLSKGHCSPALYAALALKGFFPEADLQGFRSIGSYLQGHPSMKDVSGVDMSTGSLGQGISAAVGMAIAGNLDKKDYRVYAILGDGEIQEGQVWEAMMAGAHFKLDNLCAFLDYNGLQIDGDIREVMNPENVADKFSAFNWNVIEIDAHDTDQILDAIDQAKATKGKPTIVVAHSHKGKGVSFMEDQAGWHGVAPKPDEYEAAIRELDAEIAAREG